MAAKTVAKVAGVAALGMGIYIGAIVRSQQYMLYRNRSYEEFELGQYYANTLASFNRQEPAVQLLRYAVPKVAAPSDQTSHFVAARQGPANRQKRLWVVLGGNAMLGLDWIPFLGKVRAAFPNEAACHEFLLIDYPSYGHNGGEPSPESIVASVLAALEHLRTHGKLSEHTRSISLLGCSLGSAAALRAASAIQRDSSLPALRSIVLCCPFTSVFEVATYHRIVPGFLPRFLAEPLIQPPCAWDNRRALTDFLNARLSAPNPSALSLDIIHGDQDEICPVAMGEELSRQAQGVQARDPRLAVQFTRVKGCDHNSVLELAFDDIARAMLHDQFLFAPIE